MKKRLRDAAKRVGIVVGVSAVAAAGVYTGMRSMCKEHQLFLEGMLGIEPRHEVVEALAIVFDASHSIGHVARANWDRATLKSVMNDFRAVMKTKPAATE